MKNSFPVVNFSFCIFEPLKALHLGDVDNELLVGEALQKYGLLPEVA